MAENLRLRAARKQRHWSQTEAAKACGVDLQTYYRWESGKQEPHGYNLGRLCEIFGRSMEELGFAHLIEIRTEGEIIDRPSEGDQSRTIVKLTPEQVTALSPLLGDSTMERAR